MRCPCNDTWHGLAGLSDTPTASSEHIASYCRSRWSNLPESTVPLAEVVVSHCSHPLSWLRAELANAEAAPVVEQFGIGSAIAARALLVGMERAVREMLAEIQAP